MTEVSVPLAFVAFSSFLTPVRDLSQLRVVDSACSITLTAFHDDFVMLEPPGGFFRVGGVGLTLWAAAQFRLLFPLCLAQLSVAHVLNTHYLPSRSAQHIGYLHSVSWMQSHTGCEFIFPAYSDVGLLVVPT
jgi:hypothetical protein